MTLEESALKIESLVSVVIPTLNSENTLSRCLNSVFVQTYKNIEVIIVDGGSKDSTLQIAKSFNTRIIELNIPSMTKQTNIGIANSFGKYIYRLDSDVVLSPTVLEECVQKCKIDNCGGVATYWGPDESISFWAKVRKFEKDCYKYDLKRNVARFYQKEIIEMIGGYSDLLTAGEDYDVQNRLLHNGYRIFFTDSEGLHLGEPKNLFNIIKKNYYYGKTINRFLYQNRKSGLMQISPVRMSLIKEWKKFILHPILSLGFAFYEVIVYSSAGVGFIVNIFESNVSLNLRT